MSENKKIFATPKVRKFARELGANITEIEGSERLGRITEEDVKNFVNKNLNKSQIKENIKVKSEFNHSDFGDIEIADMSRVKDWPLLIFQIRGIQSHMLLIMMKQI